jgi:prepilin-type N-terminal cleavage/methylation domain-containing protein
VPRSASHRGLSARGFTLLEILVALTVLAAFVLLIGRAFVTMIAVTGDAGDITVAGALAVRRLEEVRGRAEGQATSAEWTAAFDAIMEEGPLPFPPPYAQYAYQVLVNRVDLMPPSVAPSWLTGAPPHANTIKWVTVRVTCQGRTLAQVSSSLIRDMYHRP